jgi:hypothetical protein
VGENVTIVFSNLGEEFAKQATPPASGAEFPERVQLIRIGEAWSQ